MFFSSVTFLFFFLPLVAIVYSLLQERYRNIFLILASALFYVWGAGLFLILILFLALFNFWAAKLLDNISYASRRDQLFVLMVGVNLAPLLFYKYTAFLITALGGTVPLFISELVLPLGISFFTFHALSYCIDVWRGKVAASASFTEILLYLLLFPQLIAGPIIRYATIAPQLNHRYTTSKGTYEGLARFVRGLAKKIIIADTLARLVDSAFALPAYEAGGFLLTVATLAYALQIYFDFSGYSDMAIGLGQVFGFSFSENFNNPYQARSVRDFWRRWHMSLTEWFRDYVYIPLGGNRGGLEQTCINTAIVFILVGAWHGANWTFIVWGAWFASALILERCCGNLLTQVPDPIKHVYVLSVVGVGWVFFRSESMVSALDRLREIASISIGEVQGDIRLSLDPYVCSVAVVGILLCTPIPERIIAGIRARMNEQSLLVVSCITHSLLLFVCIMVVVSATYRPFIYFQF